MKVVLVSKYTIHFLKRYKHICRKTSLIMNAKIEQTGDIVIFNRSFWPDIESTGQFLTELAEELSTSYPVTFVAGRSYYHRDDGFDGLSLYRFERHNAINIIRIRNTRFWKGNLFGRLINWITYSIIAVHVGLWKIKPGLVIVNTDPPFLGLLGMLLKYWHRVPLIYNCRDLYPDVAIELGMLKDGFISQAFDYLNKKSLVSSNIVVPIGFTMKKKLIAKGVSEKCITVIPDWADTIFLRAIPKDENPLIERFGLNDSFVIMYSGNLGLTQDFISILHAVSLIDQRFSLVFVGDGSGKKTIEDEAKRLGLKNVTIIPYQPYERLPYSLSMADLHLVTLKKGIAGSIVPSKVYGIMAVGRAFLVVADEENEPVYLAKTFGCGIWAEPGDIEGIRNKIQWALDNKQELARMGEIGRKLAEEKFDKRIVVEKWKNTADCLLNSKGEIEVNPSHH